MTLSFERFEERAYRSRSTTNRHSCHWLVELPNWLYWDDFSLRSYAIYFTSGPVSEKDKDVMSVLNSSSVLALVYVFGGSGAKGTVLPSPHMGARGKFIILQPATVERGRWLDEQVDLEADSSAPSAVHHMAYSASPFPAIPTTPGH